MMNKSYRVSNTDVFSNGFIFVPVEDMSTLSEDTHRRLNALIEDMRQEFQEAGVPEKVFEISVVED